MPNPIQQARRHRLIALLVFVASAVVLSGLSWQMEDKRAEAQRATLLSVAGEQAQSVQSRMQGLLSSTYLLAAMVRANPDDLSQFTPVASEILPMYPGVSALSLSPGGVVGHVTPLTGNERLLGFDQLNDPRQGPEAQRTRDSGSLTLAGPMELAQGGLGVVGRLPIFLDPPEQGSAVFWGFANVTIRFPEALANTGLDGLTELGYDYELWRTNPADGQHQRIAASAQVRESGLLHNPVNRAVRVPNGEWTLSVAPRNGWGQPLNLGLYALAGALFSLMLAFMVKLLLDQHQRGAWLEQEVQARLKDVENVRQDLQATLGAIPDLLFDMDDAGVIYSVHTQTPQDLLLPISEIMGRKMQDMVPPDTSAVIFTAIQEAKQLGRSLGQQYALSLPQGQQWFELSVSAKTPAPPPDGSPWRFLALVRNVTARKEAETQYALAAKFFLGSSEGFIITDAQQRIVQVNPAFTTITGYAEADILGQKPSVLSSGRHGPEFYAAMWHDLSEHGQWQGEVWNQRSNGDNYPEWLSISRMQNDRGETTHYVAIFSDISRRREQEARIRHLAYYDPLTGLANRTLLRERAQHDLSLAKRHRTPMSLLFIDLDHFKHVNDSLGHQAGDQLLKQVAQRIAHQVREQDTVSRLGGDEFVAVLPQTSASGATHLAKQLLERLSLPYAVEQQELTVTPSIGIALYPDDGADFDTLYRCADTAMYRAKQDGRRRYAFFKPEMQSMSIRRLQLENALRRAIERGELALHYQPQASLTDGHVVGAEALLRWNHPTMGTVSPAEFIPIAEASGLILPIGEWVLRQACARARQWLDEGLQDMVVAVNLSAVQFRQSDLTVTVANILRETGLPPEKLELELTESTATNDPEAAIAIMDALRNLGIRLSVDDFGTGYSSLNHLKRFRVHKLKIDQSFVRGLQDSPEDARIVEIIIQMGHSLGLVTIAEGVETPFQQAFLRERGCDEMQGYLLARPLPANDLGPWLRGARRSG